MGRRGERISAVNEGILAVRRRVWLGSQLLFSMQVDHRHIPEPLKAQRRKLALGRQLPLLLVLSEDFSFLGVLAETVLKYHNYPYELHPCQGRQLMDQTPPLLCFQNVILSQEALVQFLCDVALGNEELDQFIARKENVKRVYRAWEGIFAGERAVLGGSELTMLAKHDHSTSVYQELMLLSRDVVNRGYQRVFPSYRPEEFNIEAVQMIDITRAILRHCPRDTCDFLLRGGFPVILDFQPDYIDTHLKRKAEQDLQIRMEEDDIIFVLLQEKAGAAVDMPCTNLNLKWFAGVVIGLAFVFGKWAH